jgi:OmpA-OmpF porin, OOP family
VVAYLLEDCSIPVGRIAAPGAMGVSNPVASNETTSGRTENRRADVKILVNKGIAGAGGEN